MAVRFFSFFLVCVFAVAVVDDDDFIYKLANEIIGVSLATQFIYFISLSFHILLTLLHLLCHHSCSHSLYCHLEQKWQTAAAEEEKMCALKSDEVKEFSAVTGRRHR